MCVMGRAHCSAGLAVTSGYREIEKVRGEEWRESATEGTRQHSTNEEERQGPRATGFRIRERKG